MTAGQKPWVLMGLAPHGPVSARHHSFVRELGHPGKEFAVLADGSLCVGAQLGLVLQEVQGLAEGFLSMRKVVVPAHITRTAVSAIKREKRCLTLERAQRCPRHAIAHSPDADGLCEWVGFVTQAR